MLMVAGTSIATHGFVKIFNDGGPTMTKLHGFRKPLSLLFAVACWTFLGAFLYAQSAWTPLPVADDPLLRMPGTQPNEVTVEAPSRCLNCHSGYGGGDAEPGHWQGSMMAQGARDFMFWSCMTVGAQDSVWALGRPNATDLCERCHFPQGWLEGRSDPTNATQMTGSDYDSLHCDVCHSMVDPFFQTTHAGTREGNDWLNYWDETNLSSTPSNTAADDTYNEDITQLSGLALFDGNNFYTAGHLPQSSSYTEAGSGQMYVAGTRDKRAPFADASARHGIFYSRFHKSKYFCGTCHDVSNPALANIAFNGTPPGDGTTVLPTENMSAANYYHVERTFSEFMLSDWGLQGGAPGIGPYAPGVFSTPDPNNNIRMCQDCHMAEVQGQKACQQNDGVIRPSGSTEHPNSGVPRHDLTGGNAWVSYVLASAISGSPNYDATNDTLLHQGPSILTLDLTQGSGYDATEILAGVDRAKANLDRAASITNAMYDTGTGVVTFRVQNNTPHKLISGFPEGRRMFMNVKAYMGGNLVYEVNPYDYTVGTLKGLPSGGSSPALGPNEAYEDRLVWEAHTTSALTGETETFHFVLATGRYKDNRIPPKGFRINEAVDRFVDPYWHGASDPTYFSTAEYLGGYDEEAVSLMPGADQVELTLYYQTTSREYVEFLRDEINGTSATLSSPTPAGLPAAYIVQTDPWFGQLKAWGDTLWQLWDHNKNVPGAAPYQMATASAAVMGSAPAGAIPDGDTIPGTPLSIALLPSGDVTLSWGTSCLPSGVDYEIYEGTIGSYTSHADLFCSTGGLTSFTFSPSGGNTYYLVVPATGAVEGSYGTDSTGAERPQGTSSCLGQSVGVCP